jgi:hypothetical protein
LHYTTPRSGLRIADYSPSLPQTIAVGANQGAARVDTIDAINGINMHLPAALAGRRFLRRRCEKGARVYGGEVDILVQPLQKVAPRLERRHFLRHHQGNGVRLHNRCPRAIVGGIHFESTFGWRARLDGYMMHFSKKSPVWVALPV